MSLKISLPQSLVRVSRTLSSFSQSNLPLATISFNGIQQDSEGSRGVSRKRAIAATQPVSQQNNRQEHDPALSSAIH